METFFTSDLHIGHKLMSRLRGFGTDKQSIAEMDEAMIDSIRTVVPRGSRLYIVGDFSFGNRAVTEAAFNAISEDREVHLIIGNHDGKRDYGLGWASVEHYVEFKQDGMRICMSHYPMVVWNGSHHGSTMLHGHSHGNGDNGDLRRFDVGIDSAEIDRMWAAPSLETYANFYGPHSLEAIKTASELRKSLPTYDHHDPETIRDERKM